MTRVVPPRAAGHDEFAARLDRLAVDWTLGGQKRHVVEESGWVGFRTRTESLFADVDSGLWRKTRLNLFEILGRPRLEDAHSAAIAWLMKPDESHGLKDAFLRAFFEKVFGAVPDGTLQCRVTPKKQIECGEVDIEAVGPGWWLVLENKVDHDEAPGQTEKYASYYKRFAEVGKSLFLVFLTRRGTRAGSRDFKLMSYQALREVLESIHPSPEAEQLVRHFVDHILCDLEN